jgi:hypothetical protein
MVYGLGCGWALHAFADVDLVAQVGLMLFLLHCLFIRHGLNLGLMDAGAVFMHRSRRQNPALHCPPLRAMLLLLIYEID